MPDPRRASGTQARKPLARPHRATAGEDVADEIAAFLGTAEARDFEVDGDAVSYSGPDEWRYRRFILHLAHLAAAAGGVDAFLIGSETVGLTQSTEPGSGVYPFDLDGGLVDLAADVSGVLPGGADLLRRRLVGISLAPAGGRLGRRVFQPRSALVLARMSISSRSTITCRSRIGGRGPITSTTTPRPGHVSIYDLDYLKANIEGGEYFDWFYASEADRLAQVRTPIEDTAHGEHWVFRQKAIRDWFSHTHRNRPGGVRDALADRLDREREAALVHRIRLPGGRPRDQSTEPVFGDQHVRVGPALVLGGPAG